MGTDLDMNANKTNFKQDWAISTLRGKPRNQVDQFMYMGSNISSTERDINICIGKVWTAIDIWKFDQNTEFHPRCGTSVWLHHQDSNEMLGEKAGLEWNNSPQNSWCAATYLPSHKSSK